jgi:hypothetical protein
LRLLYEDIKRELRKGNTVTIVEDNTDEMRALTEGTPSKLNRDLRRIADDLTDY